jgi:pimeloyl-ACP methyl ester carboxylesterase
MPTIEASGVHLYYEERGTGVPALLIHGGGCNINSWADNPDRIAERHRAIAYDRRGFGRSRCAPSRDFGEHAADARALLDRLDARPAVLVGWSSGGTVALEIALSDPEAVAGLVLIEPPFHGQLHPTLTVLRQYPRVQLLRLRGRHEEAALTFLRTMTSSSAGGNSFDTLPQHLRDEMLADAASTTEEFIPSLRPPTGEHLRSRRVASIRCPARILVGERSDPWLRRNSRRLAKALPTARLIEIPGATHSLPVEVPEEVPRHVDEVVAETGAAASLI